MKHATNEPTFQDRARLFHVWRSIIFGLEEEESEIKGS